MELKRQVWTKADGEAFQSYLESLSQPQKVDWARRIINTKMPLLAIKTPDIRKMVSAIAKGDLSGFLDLSLDRYYENLAINGSLICKIRDFSELERRLTAYAAKIDNWAHCDLLSFDVNPSNAEDFWNLAKRYIADDLPFVRRVGIVIVFHFVKDEKYVDKIFEILNGFENETEYYVNMICAWLLCECFIKHREKTLAFLKSQNTLNAFIVNKGVQKCRDSFRVSNEDKQLLLSFKIKG